jgi:hypothetical protein
MRRGLQRLVSRVSPGDLFESIKASATEKLLGTKLVAAGIKFRETMNGGLTV